MPRAVSERIAPVNANVGESRPVQATVSSAPTAAVGAPRPYDPLFALADGLSSFIPSLAQYGAKKQAEADTNDKMLGAKDAALRKDFEIPATLKEQSQAYQDGFMFQHGTMLSQDAETKVRARIAAAKDQPGFDQSQLNAIIDDAKKDYLKGLGDKASLAALIPHFNKLEGEVREDFRKDQLQKQRVAETEQGAAAVSSFFEGELTREDRSGMGGRVERLVSQLTANGIRTPQQALSLVVSDLERHAEKFNPEDLAFLKEKGANGLAIYDRFTADGRPMAPIVDKAITEAQKGQNLRIKAANEQSHFEANLIYRQQLEQNPMDLGDPAGFVLANTGPGRAFATVEQGLAQHDKIVEEQAKAQARSEDIAMFQRLGPLGYTMEGNKNVEDYLKSKSAGLWKAADLSTPQGAHQLLTQLAALNASTGVMDPTLKSTLKSIGLGPVGEGGKPTPAFLASANLVRAAREGGFHGFVAQIPEESLTQVEVFNDEIARGTPVGDAYRLAAELGSPKAKERVKAAFPNAQVKADTARKLGAAIKPNVFKRGFDSITNVDEIGREGVKIVERVVAAGGSVDTGMKIAEARLNASYVYDGHNRMVKIPPGAPREVIEKALPDLVENFRTRYKDQWGTEPDYYEIVQSAGEFTITGPNFLPVDGVKPMNVQDMADAVALKEGFTPDMIASRHAASMEAAKIQPGIPGFPQVDMNQEPINVGSMYVSAMGTILSNVPLLSAPSAIFKALQEGRSAKTKITTKREQLRADLEAQFKVPDGDKLFDGQPLHLGLPIPQPGGLNMSVSKYALQFLDRDPDFALTAMGEGLKLQTYTDKAGKRTIGLGYNIDARDEKTVKREFAQVGITGDRATRVLAGKEEITPDEAVGLYRYVKQGYESIAKSHFKDAWDKFPAHVKAVLTDVAYNGGAFNFKNIVEDLAAGKWQDAASKLTVSFRDKESQKMVYNARRVNLWRAMMQGPDVFRNVVSSGI